MADLTELPKGDNNGVDLSRLVLTVSTMIAAALTFTTATFIYLLDKHEERPHKGSASYEQLVRVREELHDEVIRTKDYLQGEIRDLRNEQMRLREVCRSDNTK